MFFSLYTLDRLLSADFGIPLMLNDSDIDTCLPGGKERHPLGESPPKHPARSQSVAQGTSTPQMKRQRAEELFVPDSRDSEADVQRLRLLPAYSLSTIARIVGRAMEIFNKSIVNRSSAGKSWMSDDGIRLTDVAQDAITLRTEVETWWNEMGLDHDEEVDPITAALICRARIHVNGSKRCSRASITSNTSLCTGLACPWHRRVPSTHMHYKLPLPRRG